MRSSGLVTPPASSAARFGKLTSKVPTLELDSSTWPEPSCREPFHAVRAVRVGMRASVLMRSGWPLPGPATSLPVAGAVGPFSADGFSGGDPVDEQPQPGLEVVELAGVEPDGADHRLRDRQRLLPEGSACVG